MNAKRFLAPQFRNLSVCRTDDFRAFINRPSNHQIGSFHRSVTTRLMFSVLLVLSINLSGAHADTPSLADRVIEHRLGNGMTVLMVERHQTPVVSINLTFGVGGMNEQVGQTGLAHLYEHMAFKGTRTVGTKDYEHEKAVLEELHRVGDELERYQAESSEMSSDGGGRDTKERLQALQRRFKELQDKAGEYVLGNEMALLYQRHGAVGLNASTGKDITRYVINLPANRLRLWAVLEADRMAHPVLREFYKERGVVMEERRLRTDDSPTGLLYETFTAAAFQAHPYGV
ncbi:MAG TPA: insulinase family protein, partial [Nitrospiraceae bacterium]|nr:insulinase family protein [Nitrospiraceae bacterium]